MAKKAGSNSGTKTRQKKNQQGSNGSRRTANLASSTKNNKQSTASENPAAGSRLAAIAKSPFVRNILAAGLVSAAGALLYNKRGSDDDSSSQNGHDQFNNDAATDEVAAPKPKRRVTARVAKAASQVVEAVEASAVGEAVAGIKRGRRKSSNTEAGASDAGAAKTGRGANATRTRRTKKLKVSDAQPASPPAGIEAPVAGLGDTEASAFAFAPPADVEVSLAELPATAATAEER